VWHSRREGENGASAKVEEVVEEKEEEDERGCWGGSTTISKSERAPRVREAERVAQRGRRGVQRALWEGANPNNSTRIYIPARTRWRTVPRLEGSADPGTAHWTILWRSWTILLAMFASPFLDSVFGNFECQAMWNRRTMRLQLWTVVRFMTLCENKRDHLKRTYFRWRSARFTHVLRKAIL